MRSATASRPGIRNSARAGHHAIRQRMKALTLQEAYRGVAIKENGLVVPVSAIQGDPATSGNIQAQRATLRWSGPSRRRTNWRKRRN